ncbi:MULTISPECIES: type VI secretion system membrane subunit TssM [unclassified Modicisalibacter]|uniref:type VI secretion system membrane subunit TssM n=1 Tax=unclassified Modicisalibacter TaxID=2679913 RepID=UPI001CCF5C78|nr:MULTISPECIES: type VI secretion system membrane subunit TssM [unclassified Modicisalibacter]MBZ9556811.1 type VI secretion system membrane subunit TssM [Modicisalibacter sp. R2A 31.J]MBZ9574719.1 type VI secretion system membrane subunit TssM [Modicisalibacter sp. MOD 31.J]
MKRLRFAYLKYLFFKYQPYILGCLFFLGIFLVWRIGVALGFSSLASLLAGIVLFLLASAFYVLLLYRGVGQKRNLEDLLIEDADAAMLEASPQDREEIGLLRERLLKTIERLKSSDDGQGRRRSKRDALYALPWYMIVGQPAAGKSTMVYQSGLNFPFAERENARVAGMGGTRHCDWFFSSDAILLDTAGRYMNSEEEAGKWKGFLSLLKQYRRHCPLNGLIVAVNISDVVQASDSQRSNLARRLRERIQEARDHLEARLPIYLVFTKCDLIEGFTPFFESLDPERQSDVLGHTFAHQQPSDVDWGRRFDSALDALCRHWLEIGDEEIVERDILETRRDVAAFRFPLELAALRGTLTHFVEALTNANPYQSAPLLRGFYFVSALQEGEVIEGEHAQRVGRHFALEKPAALSAPRADHPFFIANLFRRVIVADQHLAGLYAGDSRGRRRKLRWSLAAAVVGVALCALWITSAVRNHGEIATLSEALVEAQARDREDTAQYAQWASLDTLREWGERYYRRRQGDGAPWPMGWGLYQGETIEPALRDVYFSQLQPVMLDPVSRNLTRSLFALTTIGVYRRSSDELHAVDGPETVAPYARPKDNSAESLAKFGRATLDTYLMLSDLPREQIDSAELRNRLPAFWYPAIQRRTGTRIDEQQANYRYASRQVDFYSQQIAEPDVPRIASNAFLISSSRNYIDSLLEQTLTSTETIVLESDTLFAFGRGDYAGLQKAGQETLDDLAERLLNTRDLGQILITGHADPIGNEANNRKLSLQRAMTIRQYLVGKGVPAGLIEARGVGSERPLVTCDRDQPRAALIECLAPNRRVEIEVRKQQ